MIFGEDALGAQRCRDWNRPAFGDRLQRHGSFVMLDTGAGKKCDLWSGRPAQQAKHRFGGAAGSEAQPLRNKRRRSCNPLRTRR